MSIVTETYRVDRTDSDFVHIERSALMDLAGGMYTQKASIWFERGNLQWVVEALRTCIATHETGELMHASGNDTMTVYVAGTEAQPTVNIDNQRPSNTPHGGTYWIGMSRSLGEKLLNELEALQ